MNLPNKDCMMFINQKNIQMELFPLVMKIGLLYKRNYLQVRFQIIMK